MANYNSTFRTNYFQVTDEEAYANLYSKLRGEYLEDFTKKLTAYCSMVSVGLDIWNSARTKNPKKIVKATLALFTINSRQFFPQTRLLLIWKSEPKSLTVSALPLLW